MNNNKPVKKQENKMTILEKLMESVIIEKVDSEGIENLSSSVESPDTAEIISKIERAIKSKKTKF